MELGGGGGGLFHANCECQRCKHNCYKCYLQLFTLKDHLRTVQVQNSLHIIIPQLTLCALRQVLLSCFGLNLLLVFDIFDTVCDGITWETLDTWHRCSGACFLSANFLPWKCNEQTSKFFIGWNIFSAANHWVFVSALSGILWNCYSFIGSSLWLEHRIQRMLFGFLW